MTEQVQGSSKGMRPIWHFVGLLMLIMGLLILGTGIYHLFQPTERAMEGLHPDLWWGSLMAVFGVILLWLNKGVTVE